MTEVCTVNEWTISQGHVHKCKACQNGKKKKKTEQTKMFQRPLYYIYVKALIPLALNFSEL